MRKIIIFLILSLFFVSLVPLASISSASPVAPDAVSAPVLGITTSMPHSNDIRDLPLNDSNIQEYPLWNITFYTSQHFSIEVGNKVMETGTGPISINLNLSTYESKYINVNVTVGSIIYHFKNIKITGLPPEVGIQYASVISYMPGQNQYLYAFENHSVQMYPDWEIYLFSSFYRSYSIFENGRLIESGNIVGSKTIYLNVTGPTVSVDVSIGPHLYKYPDESIASEPLDKLYQKTPPPLVYTVQQYEYGLLKAFVASLFAFLISVLSVKKYVTEHRKREVVRG